MYIHSYRSLHLRKEILRALVQRRVEDITDKFELIHPQLISNLSKFMQRPSNKALEHVTNVKEYKELVTAVLSTTGRRSQMVMNYLKDVSTILAIVLGKLLNMSLMNYLKDVSSMLAIVSAVRTGKITQGSLT